MHAQQATASNGLIDIP